jgi:hypothetical protein
MDEIRNAMHMCDEQQQKAACICLSSLDVCGLLALPHLQGGNRDPEEVQQLLHALTLLLDELVQLPETQSTKKAAAGSTGDGAAAEAAKEEEAAARARTHGALPVHIVSAIRDALTKAGVPDKLPPACRKVGCQVVGCSCWQSA